MATIKEKYPGKEEQEEERKIPVFSVTKKGAILKNIFVINTTQSPPPIEPSLSGTSSITAIDNVDNPDGETEEVLIVGRHPDCNIVLTHPSISRFHLQINSRTSCQKLFVTDLSSVHGTWVSDEKIEPGYCVELNEGDTIRVGGSTRVYRLHWIPLSQAYDMENPFVSPTDVAMITEKEEENGVFDEENGTQMSQDQNLLENEIEQVKENKTVVVAGKEETYQDMSSISVEVGETQFLDSILEGKVSLYSDENSGLSVTKEIPSVPSMHENMTSSIHVDKEKTESPSRNAYEMRGILNLRSGMILEMMDEQSEEQNQSSEYHSNVEEVTDGDNTGCSMIGLKQESEAVFTLDSSLSVAQVEGYSTSFERTKNQSLLSKDHEQIGIGTESVNLLEGDLLEADSQQVHNENQSPASVNEENQSPELFSALKPLYEGENQDDSTANKNSNQLVSLKTACSDDHGSSEVFEEMGNQSLPGEDYSVPPETEFVNSSLPIEEVLPETIYKKIQTPQSNDFPAIENLENLKSCNMRLSSHNIWSRRGKPAAVLQLQTSRSKGKTRRPDVDAEAEVGNREDFDYRSIGKHLFSGLEATEEASLFTPEKENYSPNTLLLKSLKNKGKLEGTQLSNSCRSYSSKIAFSSNPEEDMNAPSDKENQTPKALQQKKSARLISKNVPNERRAERTPLLSLLMNSPGKSLSNIPVPNTAARSSSSVNCTQNVHRKINSTEDGKWRWTMVADTTSLLDKESRKSLQLLQGVKGTHLIIPIMVIRELDCLKRRGSFFQRTTEASLALEWIEECMLKTSWWIHVQSSVEEGKPIAPTPPASPQSIFSIGSSRLSCGTMSSVPFSVCGNLLEVVSPTAEDHILEYALYHRKMNGNGQFILLSNDTTLKIKAMAEGLICETAQEFRYSLVNPFSERFLWADSSPRGQTWSVLDDIVLKENYYPSPSKKSSKGDGAKGLKLILLHNYRYGQIGPSVKAL